MIEELSPKPVLKIENTKGENIASASPIVGSVYVEGGTGGISVEKFDAALRESLGEFISPSTPIIHV